MLKPQMRYLFIFSAFVLLTRCSPSTQNSYNLSSYEKWEHYLGDPGRSHYSTLSEFDSTNVRSLKIAWEYESSDFGQMQMNPIVIDTLLYGVSAALRAFALDARTGEEVWVFGDSIKTWQPKGPKIRPMFFMKQDCSGTECGG